MKTMITYRRLEPDTVSGEKIQLIQTFSSFDGREIDHMEEVFRKSFADGVIFEFEYEGGKE